MASINIATHILFNACIAFLEDSYNTIEKDKKVVKLLLDLATYPHIVTVDITGSEYILLKGYLER